MKTLIKQVKKPFMVILGIAQDGGVPHCGCKRTCCVKAWKQLSLRKSATSIAIVDPQHNQRWLIDITPDFKDQLHRLNKISATIGNRLGINSIFISHGHVGHFTGLLSLGKAVLNTERLEVFAMPRMKKLLESNKPWNILVNQENIIIKSMKENQKLQLNKRISLKPFLVPHRNDDTDTETVGFSICGPSQNVLFIPDIDSWASFVQIDRIINKSHVSFIDGTFFDDFELPYRSIKGIPHPRIKQSIKKFAKLPLPKKRQIYFIHFNHTNPVLQKRSSARTFVIKQGFQMAREMQKIPL